MDASLRTFGNKNGKRPLAIFIVIILVAIALRAYWSTYTGHASDLSIFLRWMRSILEYGFRDSYANQVDGGSQPNYPPVALLLLGIWAHVLRDAFHISLTEPSIALTMAMKFIANVADIVGGISVFYALRSFGKNRSALIAGAAYVFHPAMMYNSAVWGQIDAVYTMFMALSLIAMAFPSPIGTGISVSFALLSKVQAIVIGPVYAYVFFVMARKGKIRSVTGFFVTIILLCLPFSSAAGLRVLSWVYTSAVGQQSHLTSYAYNLWWAIFADQGPSLPSTLPIWGNISARTIGIILFAVTCCIALLQLHSRYSKSRDLFERWKSLSLCAAIISWGFFVWNTEAHERFLYPFCAVGIGMLFISLKYAGIYVAVSALYYFNLVGYLPFSNVDRFLFVTFPSFDIWIAYANVALLVFTLFVACTNDVFPFVRSFRISPSLQRKENRPKNSRTLPATRARWPSSRE